MHLQLPQKYTHYIMPQNYTDRLQHFPFPNIRFHIYKMMQNAASVYHHIMWPPPWQLTHIIPDPKLALYVLHDSTGLDWTEL